MMLEILIERLISEGKISQEEIDRQIAVLKAEQPDLPNDILSLKKRQEASEFAIMSLMEFI